jgi:hypothetical protein
MQQFARIGDRARFEEVHQTVREHLGVDAEVLLAGQPTQYRVRNRTDPHLQRRAIVHQARDGFANLSFDCRFHTGRVRVQGTFRPDERVYARERDGRRADVRGICSLISAMVILAESAAARAASTDVPSVHSP